MAVGNRLRGDCQDVASEDEELIRNGLHVRMHQEDTCATPAIRIIDVGFYLPIRAPRELAGFSHPTRTALAWPKPAGILCHFFTSSIRSHPRASVLRDHD